MAILDSAKITKSTISKQAFSNLYNLLNDRDNVPDPAKPNDTGTTRTRKFLHAKMPFLGGQGFQRNGWPFIVVSRSRPTKSFGTVSLTKSFMDFDFMVTIYTRDRKSDADGYPTGVDQIEAITDNVLKTLNDLTNQRTLMRYGLSGMEYNIDTDEDQDEDGQSIFITEIDLRFTDNLMETS